MRSCFYVCSEELSNAATLVSVRLSVQKKYEVGVGTALLPGGRRYGNNYLS